MTNNRPIKRKPRRGAVDEIGDLGELIRRIVREELAERLGDPAAKRGGFRNALRTK